MLMLVSFLLPQTSNVNGRKFTNDGTLQLNVDALVRDFEILGEGLVSSVEKMH